MEKKVDSNKLKELRSMTGIGFSDCRNALLEADNDLTRALDILKIKGLTKAQNKLSNKVSEGLVKTLISDNTAVIAELNCQTDFVANNIEFNNLFNQILVVLLKQQPADLTAAKALIVSGNETLEQLLLRSIAKLGENIQLSRFKILKKTSDQIFGSYIHTGAVSAGIVILAGTTDQEVAKNICMQLVAMDPQFIDEKAVDPKTIAKEKQLAEEQFANIDKPADIKAKMIEGKVKKSLASLTIVNQDYIREPGKTVGQYLNENHATIISMVRYKVGELVTID